MSTGPSFLAGMAATLCLCVFAGGLHASEVSHVWIRDPWTGESTLASVRAPNQSTWDVTQIEDYERALERDYPPPIAVLTIKDLDIQVPVYNGTDDAVLDRGAGRIKGLARPGEAGHLVISAHRDSFFRSLEGVKVGDEVLVQSAAKVQKFRVEGTRIVPMDDVSVLERTGETRLTLVTCYPFYYEGSAPDRFIVTAAPVSDTR